MIKHGWKLSNANMNLLMNIYEPLYFGYMDENTFLYYEENILARKLKAVNKLSVINKGAEVTHKHNVSIGSSVSQINKYNIYKKSQLYYERHYNNASEIQIFSLKCFIILDC